MSFQITLAGNRKAAARFVGTARQRLLKALAENPDISQADIARLLGVNRAVITRQLKGTRDISMGRAAEIAWALGYKPEFELKKKKAATDGNRATVLPQKFEMSASTGSTSISVKPKVLEVV